MEDEPVYINKKGMSVLELITLLETFDDNTMEIVSVAPEQGGFEFTDDIVVYEEGGKLIIRGY